ncbi:hypothetical protein LTS08_006341 [Lithohypha guttulata]|nr:hypothetical protein LTS08_006341 [Lithohypha guttulata]
MERPASRALSTTNNEPNPRSSTTSTVKKPATKPSLARQSTLTDRLSKPTAASATKAATTSTASGLIKPRIKPTVAAIVRKPATTTSAPSTIAHKTEASTASIDSRATDDEGRQDAEAVTAKPKRLPTSSSTTERSSTTRTPAPSLIRRTSTATSTSTLRGGATSPALSRVSVKSSAATRTGTPPIPRNTFTSTSRAKPASTTSGIVSVTDKSRSGTTADTPTARTAVKSKNGHIPASEQASSNSVRSVRPTLGSRKSTHSVLMEQQFREFELVNRMLQQALNAEGADPDRQEALETEAAETMDKLRNTLGKVRKFEKKNNRAPTEDELAEVSSVDTAPSDVEKDLDPDDSMVSAAPSVAGGHGHTLRAELNESRAHAAQLEHQIGELTAKLRVFSESAEEESEKANDAVTNVKDEHTQQIRQMSSQNQKRMDHLRTIHYEEMKELREQHQQQLDKLRRNQESDVTEKDDQLQRLQEQIESIRNENKDAVRNRELVTARHSSEVAYLTQRIEHLAKEKSDAMATSEAALDALRAETTALAAKNKNREETSQLEIERLRVDLEQALAAVHDISQYDAQIAQLKADLEQERGRITDTSKQDQEIERLTLALKQKKELEAKVSDQRTELDHLKSLLETANKGNLTIAKLEAELATANTELRAEKDKSFKVRDKERANSRGENPASIPKVKPDSSLPASRPVSPIKSDAEKAELRNKLTAMEKRHQAAKDNAKSKSAKLAEEHAAQMAEQLQKHEAALNESRQELERLQEDLQVKQVELDSLEKNHREELGKLKQQISESSSEMQTLQELAKSSENQKNEVDAANEAIKSLHIEIDNLKLQHIEQDRIAKESLAAEKEQYTQQLDSASAQLGVVQSELQELKTTNRAMTENKITNLQNELARARGDLTTSRTTHDDALKELQQEIEAARKATGNAEAELKSRLAELQKDAEEATKAHKLAKTSLENQLETTQRRLVDIESTLETTKLSHAEATAEIESTLKENHRQAVAKLKSEHDEELKQSKEDVKAASMRLDELEKMHSETQAAHVSEIAENESKLRANHEQETATLKAKHNEHLKQLEDEAKAALASLEELEATHNQKVAELQTEASAAREAALDERDQGHHKAVEKLKEEHKSLQEELDSVRATHDKELEVVRANHESALQKLMSTYITENEAALNSLEREFASKLANLESQPKGIPASEMIELKEAHAEQIRELQAQNQNLQSQAEGTRFQLQTMRGIFADQERQADEKQKEHEQELQFEKDQFSQAVLRISNHGAQLAQKDAERAEALERLRQEMSSFHDRTLRDMKDEHERVIQELTSKLDADQRAVLESVTLEHDKALEALRQDSHALDADFKKLKSDHLEALAETERASEARYKDLINNSTREHHSKLDTLKAELESTHKNVLETARAEHETALQKQAEELNTMMAMLKQEHEAALSHAQAQTDSAESTMTNNASKLESVSAALAQARAALESTQSEHEAILKSVDEAHQAAVSKLQDELADARHAVDQKAATTESDDNASVEDHLRTQLTESESKIENLTKEHQTELSEAKAEHIEVLEALRKELSQVREQLAGQSVRSTELDALKTEMEKLKSINEGLSQKQSALVEEVAEQTRRAQAAEDEVDEPRKPTGVARPPSAVQPSPSLSTKMKSAIDSAISSPKNSSTGLQSSKWATVESATSPTNKALSAEAPSFSPVTNGSLAGLGLSNGDDTHNDGGSNRAGRSERNIHGQLAGINEDIRALNDLSEQMFAENRLLAKTLGRVDESTSTIEPGLETVTVDEEQ